VLFSSLLRVAFNLVDQLHHFAKRWAFLDDVPGSGVARSIVELSGQGRERVNLQRAS
jgi:hypothetical protein